MGPSAVSLGPAPASAAASGASSGAPPAPAAALRGPSLPLPPDEDYIAVLEACYQVEQPAVSWLEGIVSASARLLDNGLGVHGFIADFSRPGHPLSDPILVGGRDDWRQRWYRDWWESMVESTTAHDLKMLMSYSAVSFATEMWQAVAARSVTYDHFLQEFAERGRHQVRAPSMSQAGPEASPVAAVMYPDSFNVFALDAGGSGAAIIANLPRVAGGPPDRRDRAIWGRIAAHIAAGSRLLRKLATAPQSVAPEAILDPRGKVHDAVEGVRDTVALASLRERVVRIERTRNTQRDDPRAVTEAWTALAAGRWSLVDEFERDGRHYYLARPNRPSAPLSSLSEREAQVARLAALGHANKLIAYELGVAISTVATHLKMAQAKLGARSRLDLIRLVRSQSGEPDPSSTES